MRVQAISQMTRETAMMAFCLPRRRAIRRYCSPRRVSVLALALTHSPGAARRYGVPLPVRPLFVVVPGWRGRGGRGGPPAACPGGGETRHARARPAPGDR